MRHNLKAAAVSALAIMAALAMSIPAYAADKKISEVKFRVNAKPEAGDSIGDPDVQVTKGNVEITEQEFDNDDSEWERGDKPVIYLTIEAKDGYPAQSFLQPSRLTKLRSDLAIRASGKLRLRCQLLTAIWIRSRILAGAIVPQPGTAYRMQASMKLNCTATALP